MNLKKIKSDAYLNRIKSAEHKAQEMNDDRMADHIYFLGNSARHHLIECEQLDAIRKSLTIYQPLLLIMIVGSGLVSLFQENLPLTAFSFLSAIGGGYLINKSAKQVRENLGDIGKRRLNAEQELESTVYIMETLSNETKTSFKNFNEEVEM
jgi:hypothetical protein